MFKCKVKNAAVLLAKFYRWTDAKYRYYFCQIVVDELPHQPTKQSIPRVYKMRSFCCIIFNYAS